jgi:hypothetical protein
VPPTATSIIGCTFPDLSWSVIWVGINGFAAAVEDSDMKGKWRKIKRGKANKKKQKKTNKKKQKT